MKQKATMSNWYELPLFLFNTTFFGYFWFFEFNWYAPINTAVDYWVHRHNLQVLTQMPHPPQTEEAVTASAEWETYSFPIFIFQYYSKHFFQYNHYVTTCSIEEISARSHIQKVLTWMPHPKWQAEVVVASAWWETHPFPIFTFHFCNCHFIILIVMLSSATLGISHPTAMPHLQQQAEVVTMSQRWENHSTPSFYFILPAIFVIY